MKNAIINFLLLFIFLIIAVPTYAQKDINYCRGYQDLLRQIQYWAGRDIHISDYDYSSDDSMYLNLTKKDKDKFQSTNPDVVDHFRKEFERILKGKMPYHDTQKGQHERMRASYRKAGFSGDSYASFKAEEEARRNSLYGPNPGAVYCFVSVSRRDFSVLYEMKCYITANKDLSSGILNSLQRSKLGYSTPKHIVGEIKRSTTQLLENLSKDLERIRNCTQ